MRNMTAALPVLLLLLGLCSSAAASPQVLINGQPMSSQDQQAYTRTYGSPPVPGTYWYDPMTGLIGYMGYPAAGSIRPGLNYGRPAADASRGNTGVFINGRELPEGELNMFRQLMGGFAPGRYSMDAQGNYQPEKSAAAPEKTNPPQTEKPGKTTATSAAGDSKLVGVFKGETITNSYTYTSTQLVWIFNPDGTVLYGARSYFSASQQDYNGQTLWTADGSSAEDIDHGRWQTRGRILSIQWDNGRQSQFRYGFEPDGSLVMRHPDSGKLINFYPRIR